MSILSLQFGTFELDVIYRLRESCTEPHTLITRPTVRKAIALNSTLVYLRYLGVFGSVPVHSLRKVKDYHTLASFIRKCVTLHSTSWCCCKLYINVIVGETNLIISGMCSLIIVTELGMNAEWSGRIIKGQRYWQERNVIQVASTRSRKMCMRKSGDCAIGIEVARNTVPTRQSVVRTELHHSKRGLGSWISITCIVGTNERVHLRGKISLRGVISSHTDSRMRQSECNCCSNEEFIVHFPKNQKGRLRQKYF